MAAPTSDTFTKISPPTKGHGNRLLAEINTLKDQFCDFVLIVQNERFHVHKIIMASASHFIRGLLNSDMTERRNGEVTLETLDTVGVRAAIHFVYSGELDMNYDKVNSVVKAASYLQIPTLIDAIVTILWNTISVDNCIDQLNILDMYNLDQDYLEALSEFICSNLIDLPAAQIHALSHESLESFLSNNTLDVKYNELKLVDVVQKWMLYHKKVDIFEPHEAVNADAEPWITFTALMTCIRWSLIPPTDLCDKLNPEVKNIMSQILECMTWLNKANEYNLLVSRQPLLQDRHSHFRGEPGLCLGTDDGSFIMYGPEDFSRRYPLPKVPTGADESILHSSAVTIGDFLYVICDYESRTRGIRCMRYDIRFNNWWKLPKLRHSKSFGYKLFAHNNKLYVINSLSTGAIDTPCEYYSVKTNMWTVINDSIPDILDLRDFAGCLAGNGIYISGGDASEHGFAPLCDMNRLDTDTNTWQTCASMTIARRKHVMGNIGEYLYVIGGHIFGEYYSMVFVTEIERYSIESNQWTTCSKTLEIPVSQACSFTKDNGIYILGGVKKCTDGDDRDNDWVDSDVIQFFMETSVPMGTTQTLPHKIGNIEAITHASKLSIIHGLHRP